MASSQKLVCVGRQWQYHFPHITSGKMLPFDVIVYATGFNGVSCYTWSNIPVDANCRNRSDTRYTFVAWMEPLSKAIMMRKVALPHTSGLQFQTHQTFTWSMVSSEGSVSSLTVTWANNYRTKYWNTNIGDIYRRSASKYTLIFVFLSLSLSQGCIHPSTHRAGPYRFCLVFHHQSHFHRHIQRQVTRTALSLSTRTLLLFGAYERYRQGILSVSLACVSFLVVPS